MKRRVLLAWWPIIFLVALAILVYFYASLIGTT